MKKILSVIFIILLCLSFAACGDTTTEVEVTATPTDKAETATPEPIEESMTLESYIDSIKSEFDEMAASFQEQGLTFRVEAEENSLVYIYQYLQDFEDLDALKPALEQSLDSMSSTFTSALAQVKAVVPSTESIIIKYLAKDGTLICSKEFQ